MSLITACAIFCSLKFHVVCTCTFFGDTICLLTNRKMIKIVTLIDLHIVLTYDCWHCFLVFSIWVSHALEMTLNLYYQTLELVCQMFYSLKILFTQPFSPCFQRLTRERAYSPVLKYNEGLWKSQPPPAIIMTTPLIILLGIIFAWDRN